MSGLDPYGYNSITLPANREQRPLPGVLDYVALYAASADKVEISFNNGQTWNRFRAKTIITLPQTFEREDILIRSYHTTSENVEVATGRGFFADASVLNAAGGAITVTDGGTPVATSNAADGTSGSAAPTGARMVGVLASDNEPAAVDGGDVVQPWADDNGRLITQHGAADGDHVGGMVLAHATGTDATVIVSPGAGKRLAITNLIVYCDAAGFVSVKDGITEILRLRFAAAGTQVLDFSTIPLWLSDNALLAVSCSAGNVDCKALGYEALS